MEIITEVCAGSVLDCIKAYDAKADRIELNNALHLGGLTPSIATLKLAKEAVPIPIIPMVRPRAGGFHYDDIEVSTMFLDAKELLEAGADGLAFGFLDAGVKVDIDQTKKMVELCHSYQVEAVFHRAFDVVKDSYQAIESLIECGVDRILTSGCADKAIEGIDLLKDLQDKYGDRIELLIGSGLNASNVEHLIKSTGINQVHSSFKGWFQDPSTQSDKVSYSYSTVGDYDGVDLDLLKSFMNVIEKVS